MSGHREGLIQHAQDHGAKTPCHQCQQAFTAPTRIEEHMQHVYSRIKQCAQCDTNFEGINSLNEHNKVESEKY